MLHDATRPDGRVLGKSVRGQTVHGRRVVAFVKPLDQVLLEQGMRPVELVVASGKQDLSTRQRNQGIARVHAERRAKHLQHFSTYVGAQRCGCVGAEAQFGGNCSNALVPQLGRRDGTAAKRVIGDAVPAGVERQVAATSPRVEELQRKERIPAALFDGTAHRRVRERQRRSEEPLGFLGGKWLEFHDPPAPGRAQGLHAKGRVQVGRERLASRGRENQESQIGRIALQSS